MKVLTIQDMRAALEFGPEKDHLLLRLGNYVEALWEKMTDTVLGVQTDRVEDHELEPNERVIYLQVSPVTSVVVVAWNDGDGEPADFSSPLVLDTDYYLSKPLGEIRAASWWQHWRFKVTGGSATVTEDVKQSMLQEAVYLQTREGADASAFTSRTSDGGTSFFRAGAHHPHFVQAVRGARRQWL